MGYDRGDSFPFDFKPNGMPFGSKSKGKLSPRSYPIQYERKWNTSLQHLDHFILNTFINMYHSLSEHPDPGLYQFKFSHCSFEVA